MDQRYIDGDSTGWLQVRRATGAVIALPEYLKVEFLERKKDPRTNEIRDYFKILEGRESNNKASVKQKPNGQSWLKKGNPGYRSAASVTFNIATGEVTYAGGNALGATTDSSNPVSTGIHDLELPDAPHRGGEYYMARSIRAKTWFLIGHGLLGDGAGRYLHPGRISAGCVTVTDVENWNRLYQYLILSRKGDNLSVGTINVIDKEPENR
jgi:hypothetical protein